MRNSAGLRSDGLPAALSDPLRPASAEAAGLSGTASEGPFDDLARLAAVSTRCSRALITLADEHHWFWKAAYGMAPVGDGGGRSSLRESFCALLAGLGGKPFAIEDAGDDPRTRDHPSVGPMKVGAWAGHPLLTADGQVLGCVCVIDENPRAWRPQELSALATVARAAGNEINLRTSLAAARDALGLAESALAASMELARSLQDSLLPPVLQPVPGLEAAASYLPASGGTTVVGDFYDLFHAKGPWWCAVMGDVCGKGTLAAEVTALARYTLRAEATQHLSPADILTRLNTAMLEQRGDDRFLTAAYATFRTTPGGAAGRLCTAGHPPALVLRADGRVRELGRPGTILGSFPAVDLADVRFRLRPGELLLLYTDGATEARLRPAAAGPRPLFGEDALAAALAECAGMHAQDVVARLGELISAHSGRWASDDTALLALRVP
jgi:serine phosphatase RsbU (regulator of sigma subunit)